MTLEKPEKIGRSVARSRAATNNAIFDCKVLSRNHALLWFENGKVRAAGGGSGARIAPAIERPLQSWNILSHA